MNGESPKRIAEELITVVEKVEQTADVPADNPDVVALRQIVEKKISALTIGEPPDPGADF